MKTKSLLFAFLLLGKFLSAQNPGDLNTEFGMNGVCYENWTDTISRAYQVAVQSNGNLIIPGHIGYSGSSMLDVFVASLDKQGDLVDFGNHTRGFLHNLSSDAEYTTSIIVLPDNKMLIAGYNFQLMPEAFVIRLLANGEIDNTFGDAGVIDLGSDWMEVTDIDIYGSGDTYKVVLCGKNGSDYPLLAMVKQDGTLETSFGTNGFLTYESSAGEYTDIVADNETGMLYASIALGGDKTALSKFNLSDGSPVAAFGTGGTVSSAALAVEIAFNAIVLDSENGKLTAFGEYKHADGDLDMCALRIGAADGTIDNTFGVNGWSYLRSAGSDEYLTAGLQQSDDKYYLGGYSDYNGNKDFLVGRLNYNGIGDNTFGTGGLKLLSLAADQLLKGIVLSPEEDMLYAVGFSYTADDAAMTAAAFHTTAPSTGIADDNGDHNFKVYPNPAKDEVFIETGIQGNHMVCIMDMTGRKVLEKNFQEETYRLCLNDLRPSVYFIKVTMPDKQDKRFKLVKQ